MDLFVEIERTLDQAIANKDAKRAKLAVDEMALELHSIKDRSVKYEAASRLNVARERVN